MALNNAVTAGLIVGIVVAIIMSSAALVMLVSLNDKVDTVIGNEQNENLEMGYLALTKMSFTFSHKN